MTGRPPAELLEFFTRLTEELDADRDESWTLDHIARRAVDAVPAAECSGITLRRRRGRLETVASTDALAERCDALQYELGEGPCMDTALTGRDHLVRDTTRDQRWPRWGPAVAAEGVRSILALDLGQTPGDRPSLGALNLYATRTDAFDDEDLEIAGILAVHATTALRTAATVTNLQSAVHSRHQIGLAQGILMQRYGISMDRAFDLLQRYSSTHNVKLRDLAYLIVAGEDLPQEPAGT